jgi:hypothetical protein
MTPYVFITICLTLFYSCRQKGKHAVNFYYWKTNVQADNTIWDYYDQLDCQRLYLRFFDIDIENDKVIPLGKIKPFQADRIFTGIRRIEYTPVVFITNRTFEKYTDDEQIQKLASHISSLIRETAMYNKINGYKEIQIDCDWTPGTKKAYFYFLKVLGDLSKSDITCTIRLHQIKDKNDTGVPPVRKGYLMCYATSDPTEGMDRNSILDIRLLKSYTQNINEYPLAFDIALPLYSWGIIKNHLGKIKLMNGLTSNDLQSPAFRQTGENSFEVVQDCFLQGMYINSGFTIKIEEITPELLNESKVYLDKKIKHDYNIVYYHLSKGFLNRFTIEDLK